MTRSNLTCNDGSIKWNCKRLCTPCDFNRNTTLARLVPCISGTVVTRSNLTCNGGSIKWNCKRLCTPCDFNSNTTLAGMVRCVSGTVVTRSNLTCNGGSKDGTVRDYVHFVI